MMFVNTHTHIDASAFDEDAEIQTNSWSATSSIGGASKNTSPIGVCDCWPK